MLKRIFTRHHDGRLRFVWRFSLIVAAGLAAGKITGMLLGYIFMLYFAAVSGEVINIGTLQSNQVVWWFTLIIEQLIMFSVILFFAYKVDGLSLKQFGVRLNCTGVKEFVLGLLLGAFGMSVVFAVFSTMEGFGIKLIRNISFNGIHSVEAAASITYIMLLFILVAFQEELLCRGYMISDLLMHRPIVAVGVPAAIFSLMHLGNNEFSFEDGRRAAITLIALFNIFLVGIIFGTYYLFSRNLWLVIGTHFSWNFMQGSVFGFNVSGIETASIMDVNLSINRVHALFTGGKIGPEGGIIVTFALVLMAAALFIHARYNKLHIKSDHVGTKAVQKA